MSFVNRDNSIEPSSLGLGSLFWGHTETRCTKRHSQYPHSRMSKHERRDKMDLNQRKSSHSKHPSTHRPASSPSLTSTELGTMYCVRREEIKAKLHVLINSSIAEDDTPKKINFPLELQPATTAGKRVSFQDEGTQPNRINTTKTYLHHLDIGSIGSQEDMSEVECTLSQAQDLKIHDFVFIRRSNGTYTYSIIADKQKDFILFVVDSSGSTKTLSRKRWSTDLRLVKQRTGRRATPSSNSNCLRVTNDACVDFPKNIDIAQPPAWHSSDQDSISLHSSDQDSISPFDDACVDFPKNKAIVQPSPSWYSSDQDSISLFD